MSIGPATSPIRRLALLAALLLFTVSGTNAQVPAVAGRDTVYSRLMEIFSRQPHRLPGSEPFEEAMAAVKGELEAAGLAPRIQTFTTMVPVTSECAMTLAGRPVAGVLPVNNGVAPLTTESPLLGPLVLGGNGRLANLSGKQINGAVVVINVDLPGARITESFMQGAQAVVLVGSDKARIWDLLDIMERGVASVPMVYLNREAAAEAGLLDGEGLEATIEVAVSLQAVETKNLWVELPATEETIFNLSKPEAIIFSATLDTYGVIPDFTPDVRRAANAALLADVLCGLAEKPRKRSLVAVFFGSHYSIQEGSRYFMYGVGGGRASGTEKNILKDRSKMYGEEKAHFEELIASCGRGNLLESDDATAHDLVIRMKEWLVAAVNNINARLREDRISIRHLGLYLEDSSEVRQETRDVLDRYGVDNPENAQRKVEALRVGIEELATEKARWNDLRRQLTKNEPVDSPESVATYEFVRDQIRDVLAIRLAEIEADARHNKTHAEVAAAFAGKEVVAHFDFDFSRDDRPWVFGVIGVLRPLRGEAFGLGTFLRHFSELGAIYADIKDADWRAPLFEAALKPYFKPASLSIPGVRCLPTLPGTILGIPGFQMMTVGEPLDQDSMPIRAVCQLEGLSAQMTSFLEALANREEFSLGHPFKAEKMEDRLVYTFRDNGVYRGAQLVNFCRASADVEGSARDSALILYGDASITTPECPHYAFAPTNAEGRLIMPMINSAYTRAWWVVVCAVGYDSEGLVNRLGDKHGGVPPQRMNMFYSYGGGLYSSGFAPDLLGSDLYEPQTLNGRTDAKPKNFFGSRLGTLSTYYTDRQIRFKRIGGKGEMILESNPEHPMGVGIQLEHDKTLRLDGIRQCAEDYWILNESRLYALRQRNIVYDSLEEVHAQTKEHLAEADTASDGLAHALSRAHRIAATCLANRVYGPLRSVTDDLVRAVVLLLLLNIPFAFAMERLVCGFTSIYKQVVGFAGFFLGTFLILFFTHPAFSLASAPIVIFLAFVIILLGAIALYIVLGKIKQEIRMIQGLASTVHGKETDSSTGLAAVLIGISGMRNRPLKTLLTATTVILLTFTILVFGSFSSEYGVVETYLGKGRGEDRVEMHTFSYLEIPNALIEAMGELYADSCHVFRRGGIFLNPSRSADRGVPPLAPDRVIYNPANGQTVTAGVIFGLERGEAAVAESVARTVDWQAEGFAFPALYLSPQMADQLGVEKGAHVKLIGRDFSVGGIIDEEALRGTTTIDETPVSPPDFAATLRNIGAEQGSGRGEKDLAEIDVGMYEWFPASQIAIADLNDLEDAFGENMVYSNYALLYPKQESVDLAEIARNAATLFQGTTHVKSSEGARRMFFTKAVAGSGFGDVIVPLLLGGLIIFSSLMGSIVDREKEIFTYSALGLSPPSIGALFFAESAVYSVVGGMGGYLLSQLVAKLLTLMGTLGWFRPPAMNFSSLSSVMTILIVMAVVMLSTIIPAVKAGRSANPGVARRWKMPLPVGDNLTFVFPFTVSEPDFKGIISFIREHFENHGDATLGGFAAREVKLFRQTLDSGKESLGIEAEISLAPFDLGIFQTFKMFSQEFEIKGIDEVVVEMCRIGGTQGSWIRSTRNFAAELREQFLLWRALPIETVEHYRSQTEEILADKA